MQHACESTTLEEALSLKKLIYASTRPRQRERPRSRLPAVRRAGLSRHWQPRSKTRCKVVLFAVNRCALTRTRMPVHTAARTCSPNCNAHVNQPRLTAAPKPGVAMLAPVTAEKEQLRAATVRSCRGLLRLCAKRNFIDAFGDIIGAIGHMIAVI